jgi:hypothetical protein
VLRCLREVTSDGQLLVDLFVNYDCDLNSSNLFERLVNGLVGLWLRRRAPRHGWIRSWRPRRCPRAAFAGALSPLFKPLALRRLPAPQVKMAQAPLPQGADHTVVQQEQWLRQEALQVGQGGVAGGDASRARAALDP